MVALNVTPANVMSLVSRDIRIVKAAEDIDAGELVSFDAAAKICYLTDTNHATLSRRIPSAIALGHAYSGQMFVAHFLGEIEMGPVLSPGQAYYASGEPGQICPISDVGQGDRIALIGIAKTDRILKFIVLDSEYANDSPGAPVAAPAAFSAGNWTLTDPGTNGDVLITIASLPSNGGAAITSIQRQVDGGTWVSVGGIVPGSYTITGLTDGSQVAVALRAANAVGVSPTSDVKTATPTGLPSQFSTTGWGVTDLATTGDIRITISVRPANGGAAISAVEYQINGGAFVALSSAAVGSYDIAGLTDGVPITVAVRAVNANGVGPTSATKAVTPTSASAILSPFSMFPAQVKWAFLQEDVADGAVGTWVSRGRNPITSVQSNLTGRPTKITANAGVKFTKGSIHWMPLPEDGDAYLGNRCWVVIAKSDGTAGGGLGHVFAVNGTASGNAFRQPYCYFSGAGGTLRSSQHDGTGFQEMELASVNDASTWNIGIWWRRNGMIHGRVNGVKLTPKTMAGWRPSQVTLGHLGNSSAAMGHDVWIDSVWMMDGEMTDYQIDIIEASMFNRVSKTIPVDHTFEDGPPVAADYNPATDQYPLFAFDPANWTNFVSVSDSIRFTHRGEAKPGSLLTGYESVFRTDFDRADQTPVIGFTGNIISPWYKPTWATTLGEFTGPTVIQTAKTMQGNTNPWDECYVMDTSADAAGIGRPGLLTLKILNNTGTQWKAGTISTFNGSGVGRSFYPGIYRTRFRFHSGTGVGWPGTDVPGLFPGPRWGYVRDHLMWRSRNRVELDDLELTGASPGSWCESNVHVHGPSRPYPGETGVINTVFGPTHPSIGAHHEVMGYLVNIANGHPVNLNPFDGGWHEHISKVLADGSVVEYIDGFEVVRAGPTNTMTPLRYFIINQALDHPTHGPKLLLAGEEVWLDIDDFEVLYPTTWLANVPTGFSGLPTIAATAFAVTVTPNTVGSQIEYHYYSDGVPIVIANSATPTLAAEWSGKHVRCRVKNWALPGFPEAWTANITIA